MKKKIFTFFLALVASVGTMSAAITVRLDPSSCSSWSTVRLWAWTDSGNIFDSWPGQIVSQDGDGWYSYTFDASITSVSIIWNNGTAQTVNIEGVTSSTCYALKSTSGRSIDVSVVDCSSGSPVDDVDYSHIQIGDLYYNLSASGNTAEVTYELHDSFSNYKSLSSVTIPSSVICNGVSYTVTNIGSSAFYDCHGLTSVTIPNSVTSIGMGAFQDCSSLTSVTIPNSVTSIGSSAFAYCYGLTSVTIPNSVTSIGDAAFQDCSSLTSVSIPNSVTSIGDYAFYYCSGLTSVTIEAETPPTLGSYAFDRTNNCPIYVPCGTLYAYKNAARRSNYASQIQYVPLVFVVTGLVTETMMGRVVVPTTLCDDTLITAVPNYGYHFTQWSDGNTDNPRTIVLTQDTTFTAEFAKNTYTISTTSANPEWGITAGGKSALYLDEIEISATPNYGYHFVQWSDGNTSNPRTVTVTTNETYTATFAKDIFSITKNAEHGTISGNSSAEYLDSVLLLVVPDRGYQFIKWADGNTENPRTIELTQDTTMEAIFDYLLTGKCGKDSALTWTFEPASMALNITGKGALSENYTYGTFIESLTIGNEVTTIGEYAFSSCNNLKNVIIGSSVKVLEQGAFAYCSSIESITCYSQRSPTVNQNALYGLDYSTIVYVPADYLETYKMHDAWGLYDVRPLGAKGTETTDVNVTPAENTAEVAWPAVSGAATYELVIKDKSGNVICTLIFNANGQLTSIAFAPSRNGAPQQTQAAGFSFTVTGLENGTSYDLTITSKDNSGTTLDTKTVSFTTTGESQGIDQVPSDQVQSTKVMRNGQIFILRGEKVYTLQGQEVKKSTK